MNSKIPSFKILGITWIALMASTIAAMMAGQVDAGHEVAKASLGPLWSFILLSLASLKCGLILWFFLNLRTATSGWKKGFVSFLFMIMGFVWGSYLLTPTL